jgi:hypothetical protein
MSYRFRVQIRIGNRWENVSTHYVRSAAEARCLIAIAKGHEARVCAEDFKDEAGAYEEYE